VFYCYQQIIAFEVVRLRGLLERKYFPQNTGGVQLASYDEFAKDPFLLTLDNAQKNSLAASELLPNDRLKALERIIEIVGMVSDELTVENPPGGPDPAGNPYLADALRLIREKITSRLSPAVNDDTRKMLTRSFGTAQEEAVCAAFVAIEKKLHQLFEITGKSGAGFVFEPNFAAGMAALASGDRKIIYLGLDALTGRRAAAELAADLIHEGSHTLDVVQPSKTSNVSFGWTVDIVYISCDGHFYLPGDLAIINAANYEQVAREMLGLRQALSNDDAAKMHRLEAPPLVLAHVLLSSRAARAWVRANDLGSKDPEFQLGSRETAAKGGLNPVLPADPVLKDAWYAGLFEATHAVLSTVNKGLTLTSADTPGGDASVNVVIENRPNTGKMTITFAKSLVAELSPEQLAMLSLLYILRDKFGAPPELPPSWGENFQGFGANVWSWGASLLKGAGNELPAQWVYNIVSRIEQMDRDGLRPQLAAYYSSPQFKKPRPS
jgi:hypothetical protein